MDKLQLFTRLAGYDGHMVNFMVVQIVALKEKKVSRPGLDKMNFLADIGLLMGRVWEIHAVIAKAVESET